MALILFHTIVIKPSMCTVSLSKTWGTAEYNGRVMWQTTLSITCLSVQFLHFQSNHLPPQRETYAACLSIDLQIPHRKNIGWRLSHDLTTCFQRVAHQSRGNRYLLGSARWSLCSPLSPFCLTMSSTWTFNKTHNKADAGKKITSARQTKWTLTCRIWAKSKERCSSVASV